MPKSQQDKDKETQEQTGKPEGTFVLVNTETGRKGVISFRAGKPSGAN